MAVSTDGAIISRDVEKKLKKDHTVYKLVDKSGKVQYVGRTINVTAREKAHNTLGSKTVGLDFIPIKSGLNYYQARGLEQIAILEYNTKNYLNSINGIGPNNKNFNTFMAAGRQFAHYVNNQISNEILYWTGQ